MEYKRTIQKNLISTSRKQGESKNVPLSKKLLKNVIHPHLLSEYSLAIDEIKKSACKGKVLIHDKKIKRKNKTYYCVPEKKGF